MAGARLFCFPHAGAGASTYRGWQQAFPSSLDVRPLQPPGREDRLREPPFEQMEPLVEECANAISSHLEIPFAFFGHSLGGMVAFELARYLRRKSMQQPAFLFLSGVRPPDVPSKEPPIYDLPDAELILELRELAGTPQEVLDNEMMMSLVLPTVRADFRLAQTHQCAVEPPLDCPLCVCGGHTDVPRGDLEKWAKQTRGPFTVHVFEGGHFYLHSKLTEIHKVVFQNIAMAVPDLLISG